MSYLINLFAFLLLLNSKYDNSSSATITNISIPLWISLSLHLAFFTYYITFKEEHIVNYISSYLILGILATVSVLICCKYDYKAKIDNWVFGVLMIVAYHFYAMEKIYQSYWKKDHETGKVENKK
jgi:hypothetical protein